MAKRVFFSFHYDDVEMFRANVVRNHWLTKEDREDAGFFDASMWESARRRGDDALRRLIDDGLENTTLTVVLIGSETFSRRWVRYEIIRSMQRGNGMFGIHINSIRDRDRQVRVAGPDPFDYLGVQYNSNGTALTLHEWNTNKWDPYADVQGYALKQQRAQADWGKFYQLSRWHKTYDWVTGDGYNNFASWVDAHS